MSEGLDVVVGPRPLRRGLAIVLIGLGGGREGGREGGSGRRFSRRVGEEWMHDEGRN